ncbi:SAP domain-containing protein [Saccharothrix australiensis]|uniref:SAP domain-containing protein n=1 Tax=Saccharothrix australiensis TaxID=2072 RepID=A0A495VJ11_9PSEU|nr:SAP domain-containing protein [Saccharothrix australiensis]RKT49359.1 SAP domain-containing protein [Saccharothrix australiensis]
MLVRYDGPHEAVEVPAAGLIVARGDTVEVPDALGARLVEQAGWTDPPAQPATPGYAAMQVAQLRAELDRHGLPTDGHRQALVARLSEHDAQAADVDGRDTDRSADR